MIGICYKMLHMKNYFGSGAVVVNKAVEIMIKSGLYIPKYAISKAS